MKHILPSLLFVFLALTIASAQPRVEEERPLARAVREAQALANHGNYGLAINTLEAALDSVAPGEHRADALYLLAQTSLQAQRYRPALTASRDFLFEYPDDRRALDIQYVRGVAAYQEGKPEEAEQAFWTVAFPAYPISDSPFMDHSALQNSNRKHEANYWLARINADRGRLDSAEYHASLATEWPYSVRDSAGSESLNYGPVAPHEFTDDALYLRGWIMEGRGEVDSAVMLYRHILDEYPDGDLALDAQLRLGVIEARRGQYESAYRLLTSLTPESDRQREEQLFYLAEVNSALNDYPTALNQYNEFLRRFPGSPRVRSARYGAGWAQLQLQRWNDAITTFRQLENGIDSIAAASSYQIGAIQTIQGDTAAALKTFEAMLYRLPYESFSDNAYFQLGRIFYRREEYDSARHYLLIAGRQFPESEIRPEAYYLLAESYVALDDPSNAQYNFARAQKVGATGELYQRALYREGIMLYKVGRFRSAIDRFREYVAQYPDGENIADATFWLGEALYQDRSYDEAERYYTLIVDRYPESRWLDDALYGLAWSRFQQKDFKGAAFAFSSFIKGYPNSDLVVEATLRLADSYRFLGDYDKAIKTYESIGGAAGKGERDEEARFRLADVFLQMGDVDRSVATFRKLIADYPKSPRRDIYALNIGTIYQEKGRDSLAMIELKNFIHDYPESELLPQAYFSVGDLYYNLPDYDSAFVYYRTVLDSFPGSVMVPEALDAVRFSLEGLGRGREAVAIIDSFMVRNPNRIAADSLTFRKGNIIFEQGDYNEAIGIYRGLLAEYPESGLYPEALYRMGQAYEYLGQRDSAMILYNDVATRFPQSSAAPKALIDMADLKLRNTNWNGAATDLERFITTYPESDRIAEARFGLGRARLMLGDTTAAMMQWHTVLDSSETGDEVSTDKARIALARVYWRRAQADTALDLLSPVVARRLDDLAAEALLLRGEIMLRINDLSGALAELKRLTNDFTTFPEFSEPGLLLLGQVYEQLTNTTAARETYTKLIAQTTNPQLKKEAETRLAKLKR